MLESGLTPDPYSPLKAVVYDVDRVSTGEDDLRLPFGLDAIVSDLDAGRIGALKNIPDALAVLDRWAERWASVRGVEVGEQSSIEFLAEHVLWALQNQDVSAWPEFKVEARQVRALVRRLLGLLPVREAVPCVHCGGQVVREWTDEGLSEVRHCTRCSMVWEHEVRLRQTNAQVLQALPETHPDHLVTLEEAKVLWRGRVPAARFDVWANRWAFEAHAVNERGVPLFRLGDVAEVVEAYLQRTHKAG